MEGQDKPIEQKFRPKLRFANPLIHLKIRLWRTEIGKWSGVKIREIIDYDILYSTLLELINDTL
jgi:hypothetical protein